MVSPGFSVYVYGFFFLLCLEGRIKTKKLCFHRSDKGLLFLLVTITILTIATTTCIWVGKGWVYCL